MYDLKKWGLVMAFINDINMGGSNKSSNDHNITEEKIMSVTGQ